MGIIFLRHAYSRFLKTKEDIEKGLPSRGGKVRNLTKEDFSGRGALFLREESQFSYFIHSKKDKKLSEMIIDAMNYIEEDHKEALGGILPKEEYKKLDDDLLDSIIKRFNSSKLENADGDIFGRIYEYFLTGFANLSAHDNGEFLTPQSIVQMIVNIIEPENGTVFDPACGTGGMFVQSAHFVEQKKKNPNKSLTFKGQEKNETTIRLAKMNLAVHGLEGSIKQGITYYNDFHELFEKSDFVMANPPFNVDEIDAEKIKDDPRLPFGVPSVNQKKKISNGNYVWISYFYSYLKENGRAGFVMSSQASSSGKIAKEDKKEKSKSPKQIETNEFNSSDDAMIRKSLVDTGHVDVMISIRSNFFYTRSVPCELWFFDKGKSKDRLDYVLMIDARNVYRKVTRKINDFSLEQLKNLSSIVWLYRGEEERFLNLIDFYQKESMGFKDYYETNLKNFKSKSIEILNLFEIFTKKENIQLNKLNSYQSFKDLNNTFLKDNESNLQNIIKLSKDIGKIKIGSLKKNQESLNPINEKCEDLSKELDLVTKSLGKFIDELKELCKEQETENLPLKEYNRLNKDYEEFKTLLSETLHQIRYFGKQSDWLLTRFPEGKLRDVEGLVKLVSRKEIKENDYSLTPGRYVGVAPEEEDDYDFSEKLKEIHIELSDLNKESIQMANQIQKNIKELI